MGRKGEGRRRAAGAIAAVGPAPGWRGLDLSWRPWGHVLPTSAMSFGTRWGSLLTQVFSGC